MGNQYSNSSAMRSFTHLNNAGTPDSFLAGITKTRLNFARAWGQGWTIGSTGGLLMVPDFRIILLLPTLAITYNQIDIGKMKADEMATTIDHRHGYENFERMDSAEKARVKSYIRSEWVYGGMLPEPKRFSAEERVGFPSNAAKLAQ